MPGRAVTPAIYDEALPSLAIALDAEAMLPYLASMLGIEVSRCSVEVLSHKPGSRATIRYEAAGALGTQLAIGKVYRVPEQAEEGYRRLGALHEAFAAYADTKVPRPEALVRDLALVFQSHVDGQDVRHALAGGKGGPPLGLAARFLARLHALKPIEGLSALSIAHELDKASLWCAQVESALPALGSRVRETLDALRARGETIALPRPSMIHKDFYYAQVLSEGARVWVVDLDEVQLGDPALDAGHFLAHLANLAYRQAGRADAYDREGAAFVDAYTNEASDVRDRVPFFQAYTFMKLAATDVSRQRGDWQARATVLSDLAARAIDQA